MKTQQLEPERLERRDGLRQTLLRPVAGLGQLLGRAGLPPPRVYARVRRRTRRTAREESFAPQSVQVLRSSVSAKFTNPEPFTAP